MRIGLLGGTFDPVHNGHLSLAEQMANAYHLDEVWFCIANQSPFKRDHKAASSVDRLSMLALAVTKDPRFHICDIELHLPSPSYTINTLKELTKEFPEHEFFLIMGSDSAIEFEKWREPEEIIKYAKILVGLRGSSDTALIDKIKNEQIRNIIQKGLTNIFIDGISSTVIRNRIQEGKDCNSLVPANVLDYIGSHRLY